MANVITAKIFASPGDNVNNLPTSIVGGIATKIITAVRPYTGSIPGVNARINVQYSNGRSLRIKGSYLVNETVATTITNINA